MSEAAVMAIISVSLLLGLLVFAVRLLWAMSRSLGRFLRNTLRAGHTARRSRTGRQRIIIEAMDGPNHRKGNL
jgi:hypothetical protein